MLQGGGALGAYEFGAVIALLELMDAIEQGGRAVRLVAVTGVSIGAINAACIVGARDRTDARRRLRALWADLTLETPADWWPGASGNLSLFGLPGFYAPRRDVWNALNWTSYYDTDPMLGTLGASTSTSRALNAQRDRRSSSPRSTSRPAELKRFRNHPGKDEPKTEITPRHVLASGSLPPQFPATAINGTSLLGRRHRRQHAARRRDRGLLGRRRGRALPGGDEPVPQGTPAAEEPDRGERSPRRAALRQPAAAGQRHGARRINELVRTVERLAALVPERARPRAAGAKSIDARRFKVLEDDHRHRSRRSGC